ncbi:MAG: thioredoxin [Armatimonadia bacterium]
MSDAKELVSNDFDTEVLQSDLPYLVDFWAPWCGPCRMMSPVVDAVAAKYAGRLKVGKVNVDEAADLAGRFGIRSIPTLMIFKGGQQVDTVVGAVPETELSSRVDKVLA